VKTKKLFDIVNKILDSDTRAQMNEIKALKSALKKLKEKAKALYKQAEEENDEVRKKALNDKITIICAQRKKGLKLLKKLKAQQKEKK
jgi:CO dehydrogenase/acetyl-CoA synthase gamma subunit (corrinoid Fe-S protein)